MLGGGAATLHFGTGLASAAPGGGRGVGPCTCEEECPDGTFCGKVEGSPEAGETYTFSDEGDEYSVTIEDTTTKQDSDEVTCFRFSSTDDIQRVCIKGGPEIATYTGTELEGELCAPTNPGGQQAEISNVSFCGTGTSIDCFQLDLVGGQPIEMFDTSEGETYGDQNRLIEDFFACSNENIFGANDDEVTVTVDTQECTFRWETFDFDPDPQVSAELTYVGGDGQPDECTGSFAAYLLPDGVEGEPGALDEQELYGTDTKSIPAGETVTLRIDLASDSA